MWSYTPVGVSGPRGLAGLPSSVFNSFLQRRLIFGKKGKRKKRGRNWSRKSAPGISNGLLNRQKAAGIYRNRFRTLSVAGRQYQGRHRRERGKGR